MASDRDYYEVLGIPRDATSDDIRRAYRQLARRYHPDVNDSEDAAERFAEVQQAYAVLSDESKRKHYDRFGHAPGAGGPQGGAAGPNVRWSTSGGTGGFNDADFGSVFEEMFGGGGPFGRSGAAQSRPRRGSDLSHSLSVSFMTTVKGGTENIRLGTGQTVEVRIPAGIDDGAKLRLRGKGGAGAHGGEAGDLILTVKTGRHPYLKRDGLNLAIEVPISIAEAVTGVSVTIPLLEGTAEVKIPPGTSSGAKLRLKERGIQPASGQPGDFYAIVQIAAPKDAPDDVRKMIDDLAPLLPNPRETAPWASAVKTTSTG